MLQDEEDDRSLNDDDDDAQQPTEYQLRRGGSRRPLRYRVDLGADAATATTAESPSRAASRRSVSGASAVRPLTSRFRRSPQKERERDSGAAETPAAEAELDVTGGGGEEEEEDYESAEQRAGRVLRPRRTRAKKLERDFDLGDDVDAAPDYKPRVQQRRSRGRAHHARSTAAAATPRPTGDLSASLKENLRRLKNVLKLPKARRWVFCEFFYSEIDRELFLGENEFSQCLRESFPNLKCRHMTRTEWREIRRLIGKPRRCSQAFFDEERLALDQKRQKVRDIHAGVLVSLEADLTDIPMRIPRALTVGAKVYARVRNPKDGIYSGRVDAVMPDSYRIIFDKEDLVPPLIVKDFEVMGDVATELVAVNYFLEKNRASLPATSRPQPAGQQYPLSPTKYLGNDRSPLLRYDPMLTASATAARQQPMASPRRAAVTLPKAVRDEKVGNFPVRLLVMLVKLSKLIEIKRSMSRQVTEMNNEAERINVLADAYPLPLQEKYAQLVVDLETVNKQLGTYMQGVGEYHSALLPHLSEVTVAARPEALRKLCHTHAVQIVKHCNQGLNVSSRRALELVTALTALLLQIRALGQQGCSAYELHSLSDALADLRLQVAPNNAAAFQDNVEVHMKQIHQMMLQTHNAAFPGAVC